MDDIMWKILTVMLYMLAGCGALLFVGGATWMSNRERYMQEVGHAKNEAAGQ